MGLLSIPDFAATIKAKYPDYSVVDDTTLVKQIVAKHPDYASVVDTSGLNKPPEAPKPEHTLQRVGKFFTEDIPKVNQQFGENFDQRLTSLGAPTVAGNAFNVKPGSTADVVTGIPERAARTVGLVGGELGDFVGTGTELAARGIGRLMGPSQDKTIDPLVHLPEKIMKPVSDWANDPNATDAEKADRQAAIGESNLLGPEAVKGSLSISGKMLTDAGKQIFKGELKIPKPLARKYGPTIAQAKRKIVNNIEKYKLESVTGDFDKGYEKADKLYGEKADKADAKVDEFIKKKPEHSVDASELFNSLEDDIKKGKASIDLDKRDDALDALNKIKESAVKYDVLPPDVQKSFLEFAVVSGKKPQISFGLLAEIA